ncbi:hypothetical protein, partial [Salmonella enterica]|uniref:hypothetical protein n=1 Tax=Salmonella enterica TaxID=28901 RepID=UPI0032B55A68
TPRDLARCVEMTINGTKSAYPAMQPAAAFLSDLEIMLRTFIAGAVSPAKPRAAKSKPASKSAKKSAKKATRKSQGDRK